MASTAASLSLLERLRDVFARTGEVTDGPLAGLGQDAAGLSFYEDSNDDLDSLVDIADLLISRFLKITASSSNPPRAKGKARGGIHPQRRS